MPALASCYFCGEAVGASLAEYDLPADADESVRVTLCASCKGKVDALFDQIDAVPGTEAESDAARAGAVGSTDDSPAVDPGEPPAGSDAERPDAGTSTGDDAAADAGAPSSEEGAGSATPAEAAERAAEAIDVDWNDRSAEAGEHAEPSDPEATNRQSTDDEPAAGADSPAAAASTAADDESPAADDAPGPSSAESAAPNERGDDAASNAGPSGGPVDAGPIAGDREPIFADDGASFIDGEFDEGDLLGEGPTSVDVEAELEGNLAGDLAAETPDAGDDEPAAGGDGERMEDETDRSQADEAIAAPPATADPAAEPSGTSAAPQSSSGPSPPSQSSADDGSSSGSDADDEADPGPAADGGTDETTDADSEATGTDGPLADVSPRTYNRVVRLLQNREFPVDRADFEVLATSAYELDHGECAAALDAAIEKGLLEEREGELRRPD